MTFNHSFLKAYWYTDLLIYKYWFKGNHLLLSPYLNHFILAPKSFNRLLGTETARGRNHLLKIPCAIFCSRMWLVTAKDCFPTHENTHNVKHVDLSLMFSFTATPRYPFCPHNKSGMAIQRLKTWRIVQHQIPLSL